MRTSPNIPDARSAEFTERQVSERRSYTIEVAGVISSVLFFVGVCFAYQTYVTGIVSQSEFEQLESGLSVHQASDRLGFAGRKISAGRAGQTETFRWENSTLSYVECRFDHGRLVEKIAVKLPR